MARHLIQNAATGDTRIVGDAALPFFPGYVIKDTLDDGQPPFTFPTTAEGDLRYVNNTELSDPNSAASVSIRAASVAAAKASGAFVATAPAFSGHRLALDSRVSNPFDILGLGDSLLQGQAVSSRFLRWPNRMLDRLRTRLPLAGVTGGYGYIPAYWTHATPANPWTFTGNTANTNTNGLGRLAKAMGADAGAGPGSGTVTVTCSSATIAFYMGTGGSATISIDGGAAATFTNSGASGVKTWSSGALSPGSHSFVVTRAAQTIELLGIMVMNGDETSGIRYWDGAQSGSRADQFNAADGGKDEWVNNIGPLVTPDLVLVEWMTNDYTARTPAQYQTTLTNVRTLVRSKTAAPILWVAPYERIATGFGGATWAQYVAAMQAVAAADTGDSAFLNVADYVPRLSPDTNGALADGTHPSDKFANYLGELVADYIVNRWAA